jgi:hypothetical protein
LGVTQDNVTVAVATYGAAAWTRLAQTRAIPSARALSVPVVYYHGYDLQNARNQALAKVETEWVIHLDADDELQLIVGQAETQDTNDKQPLKPMITTIEQQAGDTPMQLLADAGYCSEENRAAVADTTIDVYIATRKQKHGERPGPCPRGPLPPTTTIVDRMARKLHTKAGATVYAARKRSSNQ